jgi:hypothetical protein
VRGQAVHRFMREHGEGGGQDRWERAVAQQGQPDSGQLPQGEEVLEVPGADAMCPGDDDMTDAQREDPGGDRTPGGLGVAGPVRAVLAAGRREVFAHAAQQVVGQGGGSARHGGGVDSDTAQRRSVGGQRGGHEGVIVVRVVHHGERGQAGAGAAG